VIALPFEYARATSVEDAVARLAAASGGARVIAGGHSIVPLMKLRLSEPKLLIDIARIPGLAGIREHGDRIEIGAATVHHDVAVSRLLRDRCPVIADAAAAIGDQQVRNRGTLGGSIAHADPASDYPAVLLALDATILIRSASGSRQVNARDFFQDLFTVDLSPGEIITGIEFAPHRAAAYAKLRQRASHFAIVGVAAALGVSGGTIQWARIGLTGAGPCPIRLTSVEQAVTGKPASTETLAAAAAQAGAELTVINADIHASADYRRAMIAVFTRRALQGALERV
jgi:aerobic carbon-monoxide dehydrogenase medium subunit